MKLFNLFGMRRKQPAENRFADLDRHFAIIECRECGAIQWAKPAHSNAYIQIVGRFPRPAVPYSNLRVPMPAGVASPAPEPVKAHAMLVERGRHPTSVRVPVALLQRLRRHHADRAAYASMDDYATHREFVHALHLLLPS
jgi:hypothetical protein